MDSEHPAPENLIAERVVAEGMAPFREHPHGIGGDGIGRGRRTVRFPALARRGQRREGENQQAPATAIFENRRILFLRMVGSLSGLGDPGPRSG